MNSCKNCGTALKSTYCPQCGQKDIGLDRPLHELLGEVLHETLDVDGRAARTLWTLVRHPGVLTAEYLAGRRRHFSPPFRLYLVISVLFFILAAWVAGQGMLLGEGQSLEADASSQARLFADYVPRLMFFLLPVFALFLKLAFRQRLYFDHLIHALHLHSAAYLVLMLMLPLEEAAASSLLAVGAQVALFVYLLGYVVLSLRQVYRAGWPVTAIKSLVVLVAYMAMLGLVLDAGVQLILPK